MSAMVVRRVTAIRFLMAISISRLASWSSRQTVRGATGNPSSTADARSDSIDRIDRLADNAQSVPKRRLVSKILDPRSAAPANSRFRFPFATPDL
jgi:hypothetical protein